MCVLKAARGGGDVSLHHGASLIMEGQGQAQAQEIMHCGGGDGGGVL